MHTYVLCMCALGVGILREIFRNMMVTVTTGTKGLTISMTKHTHTKKDSPITRTRRDQMLSVTELALVQLYTRQSSYITM